MPNWVPGVVAGSKIRTKIDQKMRSTWEGILVSIFNGFWWVFGGKLVRKIEPRQGKIGQDKTNSRHRKHLMQIKCHNQAEEPSPKFDGKMFGKELA